MRTPIARYVLASTMALAVSFSAAAQTVPSGPPPGGPPAGGPGFPPGGPGFPPGGPGGPGVPPGGPGVPGGGAPVIFPLEPPMSEGQKLAASLQPPMPGGMAPLPAIPAEAAMPSADPRDFSGTWIHSQPLEFRMQRDMYGLRAPYTLAGAKVLERRVNSLKNGTPFINASALCRPPGPSWQMDLNFPFQIFQTAAGLRFVFQEFHGRWNIAYDAAKLPAGTQYQGNSVAHWDGNTLVVETSGFTQDVWMDVDGTPLSASGKLTQRMRKLDGKPLLEIITTIDDPKYYDSPWSIARIYTWLPQAAYFDEYNCEEQIGDPSGTPDAGLVPEPKD